MKHFFFFLSFFFELNYIHRYNIPTTRYYLVQYTSTSNVVHGMYYIRAISNDLDNLANNTKKSLILVFTNESLDYLTIVST